VGLTYRLDDPTSAISTGGLTYDTQTRSLTASAYNGQVFAVDATSSKWAGAYWTSSGASFWNGLVTLQVDFRILFNEVCPCLQLSAAAGLLLVLTTAYYCLLLRTIAYFPAVRTGQIVSHQDAGTQYPPTDPQSHP
jgi:hypothetical protein